MKRNLLYGLRDTLEGLKDVKGTVFAYAVVKNLRKINSDLAPIKQMSIPSPELIAHNQALEVERLKLLSELAEKDDKGKTIFVDDKDNVIPELKEGARYKLSETGRSLFTEKWVKISNEMNEKAKDVLAKRNEQQVALEKFLEEDSLVELHKIKREFLPDNLTANQLIILEYIIQEEDNEK